MIQILNNNFSGPEKYINKHDSVYDANKMSPDVDQSCVFPSEDGYGEHNGCRRIEDWEETGIPEWRIKLMVDAVCSTEVDYAGLALSHRWGWCRPVFCPQEGTDSDTTWGIDETLTVTTHTVIEFDEDLYVMIPLLILLAFCLFSFSRTLRRHGTFMCRQFDILVMVLITDEKITRVIRKVIEFFSIWLSTVNSHVLGVNSQVLQKAI